MNGLLTANSLAFTGGTATLNDTVTVTTLSFMGGTGVLNSPATATNGIFSNGELSGSGDVTVTNVLDWTGGAMSGAGKTIIPTGATLNISVTNSVHYLNRMLENNGTTTWTGGVLDMSDGMFQNNGTFTANSDSTLDSYGRTGTNVFQNAGTFVKQGTGTTQFRVSSTGVTFNNADNVDVQAGTLSATNPGTNSGTISVTAGSVVVVTGSFTQSAAGGLAMELRGTGSSQFGRVTISGAVTLDGTLSLTVGGGFVPAIGDEFQLLTYGSHSGTFTTINGNGLAFSPTYNATNLTLTRVAPFSAAEAATRETTTAALSHDALAGIVQAANSLWASAGLSIAQRELLNPTQFIVADLAAVGQLANSRPGVITIDDNAAGFGWFIDATPDDDDEFQLAAGTNLLRAVAGSAADGHMDLLTVVLHELGHQLGFDHADDPGDLLFETLAAGRRKRLSALDVDAWFGRQE